MKNRRSPPLLHAVPGEFEDGRKPTRETLGFQAEVKQLLQADDPLLVQQQGDLPARARSPTRPTRADKLRFEALTDKALYESDPDLKIRVSFDPKARTITVSDNGIGMSRQEVIENIGTIAKSGTREFFDKLTGDEAKDAHLIGQFGVGFYSTFIVADKVTRASRGAPGLHAGARRAVGIGRQRRVHDRDGRPAAARHRSHAAPARRRGRAPERLPAALDHPQVLRPHRAAHPHEEGGVGQGQGREPSSRTRTRRSTRPARCGRGRRTRSPKSSTTSSTSTSRTISSRRSPTRTTRSKARKEYTQLLYIPARAPFDLWDREHRRGIKLYVRRVFIMDDAEHLMPAYLRFVRGVDRFERPAAQRLARDPAGVARRRDDPRGLGASACCRMLEDLAENQKEKYATFWKEFGRVFKEGLGEDHANRERIAKLLRFASTHKDTEEQDVSLADYVGAHEGRAGQDLLRHRGDLRRREEQPAPRDLPQERHRSAAAVRPRGRVGAVVPSPSSKASRCSQRRQRRPRSGQARGRGRRRRSRRRRPASTRT